MKFTTGGAFLSLALCVCVCVQINADTQPPPHTELQMDLGDAHVGVYTCVGVGAMTHLNTAIKIIYLKPHT